MRLIDADVLKEEVNKKKVVGRFNTIVLIDNAPTVDIWQIRQEATENALKKAEVLYERPQGEWIDEGQYAEGYSEHAYACKKCGYHIIENPNMIYENRFCKYCGADMRKGGAE